MKVPKSVLKLLENKYVLYFVLFLAVTNVFGYMVMGNTSAVVFFILVGYLVYNFSKNMIIVLSVPLVLTSVFMVGKAVKESFDNPDKKDDKKDDHKDDKKDDHKDDHNDDKKDEKKEIKHDIAKDIRKDEEKDKKNEPAPANKTTDEQFSNIYRKDNRIDYAATVEDAYDDLNKILGGDGIKRLTDDTQKLMSQQMQLADAMKSMSPLLEQAKDMLKGFDLKNLDGIANLAKSFNSAN
jgi:uncharacterized membrane protein YciS (DUF1049 family)